MKCTCEYCCFVQDEEDDEQMELEHKTFFYSGEELFNSLSVGDIVQFYHIPYEDRKIVFLSDEFKWEYIKKFKSYTKTISFKNENCIKLNDSKQIITPAECFAWGMHKIKNSS